MAGEVDARKNLVANGSERVLQSPVVQDCENLCLFKDKEEKNYWCFEFETPFLKMGWEWKQTNNTDDDSNPKYFRQDLNAYVEYKLKMKSKLKIDNLYQNTFTVNFPSSKALVFTSFIVN